MTKVNIQEAKTHLSRYIDKVEQGEVVVICRHNRPVAELRAIEVVLSPSPRVPGLLKGQVNWDPDAFAPMTDEEVSEYDAGSIFPITGSE